MQGAVLCSSSQLATGQLAAHRPCARGVVHRCQRRARCMPLCAVETTEVCASLLAHAPGTAGFQQLTTGSCTAGCRRGVHQAAATKGQQHAAVSAQVACLAAGLQTTGMGTCKLKQSCVVQASSQLQATIIDFAWSWLQMWAI